MSFENTGFLVLFVIVISVLKRYFTTTRAPMSKETVAQVKSLIDAHPVFVASKSYCPYCSATKKLLASAAPEAFVIELDQMEEGDDIQQALAQITGQRTVPNVFIKGKHIGGNSDLQALGEAEIKRLVK